MKYSTVLFLASGAYAASSTLATEAAATADAAPVPTASAILAELKCLKGCDPADVTCRASCEKIPAPNSAMAEGNNKCVSKSCIPLQSDVPKYADCVADCAKQYFFDAGNPGGVPNAAAKPTGGSGSGSGSGSDSGSGSGSDSTATGTEGSTSTATGSAANASSSNSAGDKLTFSIAGALSVFGLVALAL